MGRAGRGRRGALWLAAAVSGCFGACKPRPLGDPQRWESSGCVATLTIEHDDSPLSELRERGEWRDDFQVRFPAAVIDPSTQHPVSAVASMTLDSQPIAWFSAEGDVVVLDGAAFAPLRRADPTRLGVDEREIVGRVTPRALEALGARRVVELLMRVGAIQTYWHLGADLCLISERGQPDGYRASFSAVHHYVSNAEREARYGFSVTIDADGEVTVIGAAATFDGP